MIQSMTGFGQAKKIITLASGKKLSLSVELKSLNSRYFEVLCKLPSSLNAYEISLSALIKKELHRGKTFCVIKVSQEADPVDIPVVSLAVAHRYVASIQLLQKELNLPGTVTITDILQLPDLFNVESEQFEESDFHSIQALVQEALASLVAERKREGESLEVDIQDRFQACIKKMEIIKKRYEELLVQLKKEVADLSEQVQAGAEHEKVRLDELYVQLNKMDINEEVTRFVTHHEAFLQLLKDKKIIEKGRRLDFLLQELFREINTITAKCSDAEITTAAVDIKVEVEKVREQVQNIL